jgi:hypothetical protein
MRVSSKHVAAWLPVVIVPIAAVAGSGLGCELVVGNLDTMLVDGSPDDVTTPMTLDGYSCKICKDVSPEADFDGDMFFPEAGPEDAPADAGSDSSGDAGAPEGGHHEGGAHD